MILSDADILRALDSGRIDVEPSPDASQIQPASLDVRLGAELYNCTEDAVISRQDHHTLAPNTRYLGHTHETVSLPDDVAAQLTGRSTIGRLGVIVHKTAGWIDPGFSGNVTLELYNHADRAVPLDVGQRVAQLVFFELSSPSSGYDGKYQNQKGPKSAIVNK